MNTFNTLKATAAVAVLSFSLIGAANAESDTNGGLMNQLMSQKNQVQAVTNSTIDLNAVVIKNESGNNGGLMKEMSPIKIQNQVTESQQAHLNQVVIPAEGDSNV